MGAQQTHEPPREPQPEQQRKKDNCSTGNQKQQEHQQQEHLPINVNCLGSRKIASAVAALRENATTMERQYLERVNRRLDVFEQRLSRMLLALQAIHATKGHKCTSHRMDPLEA